MTDRCSLPLPVCARLLSALVGVRADAIAEKPRKKIIIIQIKKPRLNSSPIKNPGIISRGLFYKISNPVSKTSFFNHLLCIGFFSCYDAQHINTRRLLCNIKV